MKTITLLRYAALATLFTSSAAFAGNWAHWRGPEFNGSSPEKSLPDNFSKTENVKWVAPLPGPSAATPIVWGDTVFISSTDTKTKTLHAMAFDRKTGKELWNVEVATGLGQDNNSNFASPSPTTDGKLVYFLYGTGDLVAFDFKGKQTWSLNLQTKYAQFAYQWTYGASPTLFGGKLYVQVLNRDVPVHGRGKKDGPGESYLLALDPATGKEILTLTGHTEEITTVSVSPDGGSLLTGSRDGTAIVWLTVPWTEGAPVALSYISRGP